MVGTGNDNELSLEEIGILTRTMRKAGVKTFRYANLEVTFESPTRAIPVATRVTGAERLPEEAVKLNYEKKAQAEMPSDDELLYYSSN